MIDFSGIALGEKYDRPTLAKMWGYKSYAALGRGVFTPKGENRIILFITKEKQESLTQYEDHIDQDILSWEGENGHGTDARIVSRNDEIHVFYRERHHSDFNYEGRAYLEIYSLNKSRPSRFRFQLLDKKVTEAEIVENIKTSASLTETEKEAIILSRRGQGIFRDKALELWKSCSVTAFEKREILVASHIKPWKISSNDERLSPYNSLLLVPTLDKLFDRGYVGFEPGGRILLSSKIEKQDWARIGLGRSLKLRRVPSEIRNYLAYHSEYIFDLVGK